MIRMQRSDNDFYRQRQRKRRHERQETSSRPGANKLQNMLRTLQELNAGGGLTVNYGWVLAQKPRFSAQTREGSWQIRPRPSEARHANSKATDGEDRQGCVLGT